VRVRHLSTEELLLQCEGELGFERATHLDECEACRSALVHMVELLGEAEQELRSSVAAETPMEHAAAWESLEQRIGRPTVVAFPVRWVAPYAAAAALGFAVFSGVVGNDLFAPDAATETTTLTQAPRIDSPELPQVSTPKVPAVAQPETVAKPAVALEEITVAASRGPEAGEPAAPVESAPIVAAESPAVVNLARARPQRYQLDPAYSLIAVMPETTLFAAAPEIASAGMRPIALAFLTPRLTLPAPEPRTGESPAEQPLTLAAAQSVIEGHWILHRARVWREDVLPAWTKDGLVFRGTVENERAREAVTAAIRAAQKDRNIAVELTVREPAASAVSRPLVGAQNAGLPGGLVRTSLLEHFGDAARRSFASTQPSALEGELDRFVNSIFESQSRLLSHAYELNSLMQAVPVALMPELTSSSRLMELVTTHANEVRREQAHIYDLLSEGLPRKYWTYQANQDDAPSAGPRAEAEALLQGALELDANLTALLSTPRHLLDAGDSDVSCGEALSRIRTGSNRIKAATAKLR